MKGLSQAFESGLFVAKRFFSRESCRNIGAGILKTSWEKRFDYINKMIKCILVKSSRILIIIYH